MAQEVIAIICDCDGTLCPDTTDKLVRELGLDSAQFWGKDVDDLVENGWDHTLAYLNNLLESTRDRLHDPLTLSRLRTVRNDGTFYPGALDFAERLRGKLSGDPAYC